MDAIKVDASVKERLVAQAVLSLQIRQKFSLEQILMHGLINHVGAAWYGQAATAPLFVACRRQDRQGGRQGGVCAARRACARQLLARQEP